jgi:TetR/AcrR family transcriptional regulator, mexJK operon transcriptional repressor
VTAQPSSPGRVPRRGRPPSAAKGAAILEAATEVFLREGYDRTSLDVVAGVAGVSKQTVYSRYADKEALFLAVVGAARTGGSPRPEAGVFVTTDLRTAPDLPRALVALGEELLAVMLRPRVAALRRVMIAELARRPKLQELWRIGGPNELFAQLGAELADLDAAGGLVVPDPARAARHLVALLAHEGNMQSLYGVTALTAAQRRDIAVDAADMFLRAYGSARDRGSE